MPVWNTINHLVGQQLHTLGRNNAFTVLQVNHNEVVVMPHATQIQRSIPRDQINEAYQAFVATGQINLQGIRVHCEMSSAYVATFFAQIPGVVVNREGRQLVLLNAAP